MVEEEKIEAVRPEPSGKWIWVKAVLFQFVLGVPLTYALALAIMLPFMMRASGDEGYGVLIFLSIAPPFIFPISAFVVCGAGLIIIKKFRPEYRAYAKPLRYSLFFWGVPVILALLLALFLVALSL